MPDKSAEKFARVVEARLVPPLTYIIRFPNGEKIGPWKSSVAADEVAEVINAAHEKAVQEKLEAAAKVADEWKCSDGWPCGESIAERIRALRGNG